MATLRLRDCTNLEIPPVIWCPVGDYLYSGSPLEMVQQMADEMGDNIQPGQAIYILVTALAYHRQIYIGLPEADDNDLAGMFITALLDQGVSRPLVAAA